MGETDSPVDIKTHEQRTAIIDVLPRQNFTPEEQESLEAFGIEFIPRASQVLIPIAYPSETKLQQLFGTRAEHIVSALPRFEEYLHGQCMYAPDSTDTDKREALRRKLEQTLGEDITRRYQHNNQIRRGRILDIFATVQMMRTFSRRLAPDFSDRMWDVAVAIDERLGHEGRDYNAASREEKIQTVQLVNTFIPPILDELAISDDKKRITVT